jgi:hypothetical protein
MPEHRHRFTGATFAAPRGKRSPLRVPAIELIQYYASSAWAPCRTSAVLGRRFECGSPGRYGCQGNAFHSTVRSAIRNSCRHPQTTVALGSDHGRTRCVMRSGESTRGILSSSISRDRALESLRRAIELARREGHHLFGSHIDLAQRCRFPDGG